MFSTDAELFFLPPRTQPVAGKSGVLYLLRRDIDLCMEIDPTTQQRVSYQALWPGAMAILAGIDLLAKFFAGSDATGQVSQRFRDFLDFLKWPATDRKVIYQLRNSLLHSFGLYSQDQNGKVYHFFLTGTGSGAVVSHRSPDQYYVDLRVLHRAFEKAVEDYRAVLDSDSRLQANFAAMFGRYGCIHIA
jgi:hypothetical protein